MARPKTAAEMFWRNRELYGEIKSRIGDRMRSNAEAFSATGSTNYSQAGTEAEVIRQLAIVLAFLGDTSMVEKLGIEY